MAEESEAQQQMAHLDFAVNDWKRAVEHAISAEHRSQLSSFPMTGESC